MSVAVDNVVYTYQLKNNAQAELALFASVAMPVLAASADGSETWALPSSNPENPVSLIVAADGTLIATKVDTRASALGVDRLGEIRAAHLPLVPFDPEIDKASRRSPRKPSTSWPRSASCRRVTRSNQAQPSSLTGASRWCTAGSSVSNQVR